VLQNSGFHDVTYEQEEYKTRRARDEYNCRARRQERTISVKALYNALEEVGVEELTVTRFQFFNEKEVKHRSLSMDEVLLIVQEMVVKIEFGQDNGRGEVILRHLYNSSSTDLRTWFPLRLGYSVIQTNYEIAAFNYIARMTVTVNETEKFGKYII
jgi:hypothetical protein